MLWLFLGSHIVWSNFDWVSNVIRDCCVCALLRSMIGPENLRQPIRCGTITNNCLVVRVFPRFRQFDYFYCAFSLALWVFSFLFNFFFFPHVSRTQRLAPARTRTRVVRLGAQCTDHWTTGQSRGVGVPAVQLTTHVKSSTLYGRTSKFFRLDGLLLFCIIMGLRSASSAIILWYPVSSANPNSAEFNVS